MDNIHCVCPLEDYKVMIKFNTGSSFIIDLREKLKTARFAELSAQDVFKNVRIENETVIWGEGILKIPLFELIDIAVSGM